MFHPGNDPGNNEPFENHPPAGSPVADNQPHDASPISAHIGLPPTLPSEGKSKKDKDAPGVKSLLFCLVLENPFFPHFVPRFEEDVKKELQEENSDDEGPHSHRYTEDAFTGYPMEKDSNHETHLQDDDLLLEKGFMGGRPYPSRFWKVIEIIRRLEMRKFNVMPANMVVPYDHGKHGHVPPNCFHGYALDYNALILSPDKDEMYIRIHGKTEELLKYAEMHQIQLKTNPDSDGGGMMMPYSAQTDMDLRNSIARNRKRFAAERDQEKQRLEQAQSEATFGAPSLVLFEESDEDVDEDDISSTAHGNEDGVPKKKNKHKDEGFIFTVPDKMRIVDRMVREGWSYGGCGIQVIEMKNKGILVKHFIPLHNKVYQKSYGIDTWGSFWALARWHPWFQSTNALMSYFGEEIALYFHWLKELTMFLPWIAFPGIVAGFLPYCGVSKSLVNGSFSVLCVVWGIAWNSRWAGLERVFATRYNQDAFVAQEAVRDEFRASEEKVVYRKDIFNLNFAVPLSLTRRGDELIDRHYSNSKRLIARYLISYPIIILLTAAMIVCLIFVNMWRFEHIGNDVVSYASSICAVAVSVGFGVIFDKIIGFTNYIENNRTDNDEEEQIVLKSFFFSFFSFYFSMFIIGLWPDNTTSNTDRLKELETQMIIITIVKPMIQNLQESILPWLMTQSRRRIDSFNGVCGAIVSVLTCERLPLETEGLTEQEIEGMMLWKEAQREPYLTTAGDYLEIALQFGYMTMFATTFPWAPIAAFVYNTIEIRVDANKLLNFSQRTIASPANNIGGWSSIFILLSGLSIVTNSYLVVMLSPAIDNMNLPDDKAALYESFIALQYMFIGVGGIWALYGSSKPAYVRKVETKYDILRDDDSRRQARRRKRHFEEGKKRRLDMLAESALLDEASPLTV